MSLGKRTAVDLNKEEFSYLVGLAAHPAIGLNLDEVDAGTAVSAVLRHLIASIVDGCRRPGSWERQVVIQLFGERE